MIDREVCPSCGGTRFAFFPGGRKPCFKCKGQGYLTTIDVTCNRCHGNGKIDMGYGVHPLECPTCKGKGTVHGPGQ